MNTPYSSWSNVRYYQPQKHKKRCGSNSKKPGSEKVVAFVSYSMEVQVGGAYTEKEKQKNSQSHICV